MKIKLTSVHVDDQEKALRFYTDVLGFVKKAAFSQGPYRWLTVVSPQDPDGTELQLALNDNPAAKAYQQAMFQQSQPAAMFFTDDVQADYERMKAPKARIAVLLPRGDMFRRRERRPRTRLRLPAWRRSPRNASFQGWILALDSGADASTKPLSPYDGFLPADVGVPPSSNCNTGPDGFDEPERPRTL
jgi:catechol 2,3-dioxygenase-like lactoylglutathione lyase family enzyme